MFLGGVDGAAGGAAVAGMVVTGGVGAVADGVALLADAGAGAGESLLVGETSPNRHWANVAGETGMPNSLGE